MPHTIGIHPQNHFQKGSILSDHAYQSTNFTEVNPHTEQAQFSVNVGSWNLQNLCVSKATNSRKRHPTPYANSPYPDYDESIEEYVLRKNKQIDVMLTHLSPGFDAILCLQEADFLFPIQYQGRDHEIKQFQEAQIELKKTLESRLDKFGIKMVCTSAKNPDGTPNQKMAILYDANRFRINPKTDVKGAKAQLMALQRQLKRSPEYEVLNPGRIYSLES